jgi:hypothetical protein
MYFIYITGDQFANSTPIFIGDKHEANFISQPGICWNDTLIIDNRDFVYEVNTWMQPSLMKSKENIT